MTQITAFSILALTVTLSLSRPSVWRFRINHEMAAVLGALLCIVLGVVSLESAFNALLFLSRPVVTIVSLMTITIVAEQAGVFDLIAHRVARAANGDARKLFAYLFLAGTVTGALFTNDAAVLIFTPLVVRLVDRVKCDDWTPEQRIPFYFAVLYVANVAGVFIISNPINIVASQFFDVGFLEYAQWMVLPAIVSIVTSYIGLRLYFRRTLPRTFNPVPDEHVPSERRLALATCTGLLFVTLVAFFCEGITGVPVWLVALAAAVVLLIQHVMMNRGGAMTVIRGIGWDVIIFVVGIFIVANGLRGSGFTALLGEWLRETGGEGLGGLATLTAFVAAGFSAVMNNHPTADMMAFVIQDLGLDLPNQKILLFAALIGGDLGPKMLPIGSLAALMWFRILRQRGIRISYWTYVKVGIPVTLSAIALSTAVLYLEVLVVRAFG